MQKLPRTVQIFGKTFKVKVESLKDKGLCGYVDTQDFTIYVDKALKPVDKTETIIHEIVHALLFRLSFYQMAQWNPDIEELIADNIAKVLLENFKILNKT